MRPILGEILGGVLVNHLCYADDICLISLSSAGMQQLGNICDIYAKEYDLLCNGSKFDFLFFQPKCSKFHKPVFTLTYFNIPTVNQWKYIRIIISENSCAPDLKQQMCKLYANVN